MQQISEKKIRLKLQEVLDPELGISIIDMGLVYKISINKEEVNILMTLTTMGCPLISVIENDVKNKIHSLGIKKEKIKIELTFNPPWTIDKMSKSAKAKLGI